MTESGSFLQSLDEAVSRGSPESCKQALWHATDLLIAGRYTDDQIWIFGEVIERLADELEVAARAQLARRLAPTGNAPVKIVNQLALDDSIDVAGPVLRQSQRLDVRTLVAAASSKSQQHLLAISKRSSVSHEVTDVLVTRGNREVVNSVATNVGACFSNSGFLHLIKRSEGDSILAENIGLRKDIPRHLFQQLIAKASEEVKRKLASERPEMQRHIQTSVADATGALHSKFGPASKEFFAAKKTVLKQHQSGHLKEKQIFDYAIFHKFEEATIGLSLLCSLPVNVVERALVGQDGEMLLVLTKALGFSWKTTTALLFLGARDHQIVAHHLDALSNEFARLNVRTCQEVLKFYQTRKEEAPVDPGPRRLPQLYQR
jgi:uncharacterized protein (DUF2336 family)